MAATQRATSRAGLLAAALVLVATGCSAAGDEDANEGASADGAAAVSADSTAPTDGSEAQSDTATPSPLSFSAQTVSGGTFDASELAGEPVVLWFWAPWCTVCRAEAGEVAAMADTFDGKVTFVGIPGRGQAADMRAFVEETNTAGFEHAIDDDGSIWQRFGVVSQPAFAFIARDGTVETFSGSLPPADLERTAQELANG